MSPVPERFRSVAALDAGRILPLGDAHRALLATSACNGSAVIVSVGGEVDASNEDVWNNLLTKMAASAIAPGPFVVDVRGLRFMGSGGFVALAREARRCRRRGVSLCLVSNQPVVARIVAASGLRPLLSMHPTVEAALSAATAEPSSQCATVGR
ncbi:anti-sigma factor antagonist [Mycobacterium sp.]|uniref:anti-sigma factor antagonist n=1 Tax=Mycobacterium sp. TaxID=1785 RepID=UPI0031DF9017